MYNLHGMYCSNGEGGGLFVFVVHFVEVLVEERRMVNAVQPVRRIVLINEYDWPLKKPPNPCILVEFIVDCGPSAITKITC